MKKIILTLLALGCAAGCGRREEHPAITASPSSMPQVTSSAQPQQVSSLSELLQQLKDHEDYQLPPSMEVDQTVLNDLYGLSSDQVSDYAILTPAMNVHATEIILVQAREGKLEEVKQALEKRMDTLEQTWSAYLPEQYDLVVNRVELQEGNIVAIVIAEQAQAIAQQIQTSLQQMEG